MERRILLRRIRIVLLFFMCGLLLSGLTAFPLEWELGLLNRFFNDPSSAWHASFPAMAAWVAWVYQGLRDTNQHYPFIAYGTDWLAFAHIVITIAFIGPLRDPVRNRWVVEFGIISCLLVLPLALIMGPIRDIPFFHRLIDCAFGVVGIVPLWWCRRAILRLERAATNQPTV